VVITRSMGPCRLAIVLQQDAHRPIYARFRIHAVHIHILRSIGAGFGGFPTGTASLVRPLLLRAC
jgi:hypothetical protein